MSENQPSEHDRQQRLAELQARLQKLTEERKAELRRSDPSMEDAPVAPVAEAAPEATPEASAPEAAVPSPAAAPPVDPQPSAPPPPEPLPVVEAPPPMETPADPQPVAAATTPPDSEPTWLSGTPPAEAAPIAATRQASALSEAAAAFAGKISVVAVEAKRAAQGLWRQATAQAHALKSQRPPRKQRAQLRPDVPAVGDEPAERPAKAKKKKTRSLRAAILVGLGLIGGVALMQFGDLELPEALDGALPAAEMNDEGSQLANAAGSTELVETDAGPLPGQALASGSAGQALADGSAGAEGLDPVETAPAEIQPAPPELEITTPSAPDVAALEVDLALLEPAASEPIPIGSSFTPLATGNPTQRPTFIPYDVPPKLENAGEIQRLLERGYPSQLRDAGIEGTVILWIFVDAQGAVQKMEVKESSGYELMDEAALSTAEKMRFAPAMNRDKATPVWLAQPITFR